MAYENVLSESGLSDDDIRRRRQFALFLKQQALQNDLGPARGLGVAVKGLTGFLGGYQDAKAQADDKAADVAAGNDLFEAAKSLRTPPAAPAYDAAQPSPAAAEAAQPFDPATAKTYNPAPDASTNEMFDVASVAPTKAPLSPEDRDYAIRTLYGEANGQSPEGQAAVAHVLFNRLNGGQYGKSVKDVALAPHQFEPWSTRKNELMALSPRSQGYQSLGNVVDTAWQGLTPDPTGGATNFLNKEYQVARGDKIPDWAQGEGKKIGDHTFYGAPGQDQPAQMSALGPDDSTDITNIAPTGPGPKQEETARRLLQNPRTRAMGVKYLDLIFKDQTEERMKQLKLQELEANIAKTQSETGKKKAPEVREFYDDQGRPVKKYWDEDQGNWVQSGAAKTSQANMNPTTQKAILNADDVTQKANGALVSLKHALDINDKAYSGPLAKERGYIASQFGAEGGNVTEDLSNTVLNNALSQLKAVFGGNPTEGERAILIEVQGSVNQTPEVRKGIFERAQKAIGARRALYVEQSKGLRDGTYYTPEGAPNLDAPGAKPESFPGTDEEWKHVLEAGEEDLWR